MIKPEIDDKDDTIFTLGVDIPWDEHDPYKAYVKLIID